MSEEIGAPTLLDERPELEPALETVLAVDAETEEWTFDDVAIDSGAFGELVSRGVVEKTDDGQYQLANPDTVRRALDGESADVSSTDTTTSISTPTIAWPTINTSATGMLVGALAVVFIARSYILGSIYRNGDIVLSGNDPYYYRYWVEQVAAQAGGTDLASLAVLPSAITKGEPLMVATLWWLAELFGGSPEAVGHVLAWYPVGSAVLSALFLYLLAVRITSDRRIGLASVLVLAFIPGHAFRTSLGFADHHAFDYPWLGLTALSLLIVLTVGRDDEVEWLRTPTLWLATGTLGIGITGQVLSWEAGPLLIAPVGLTVLLATIVDRHAGRSATLRYIPVLVGTGLGALLTWIVHTEAGWHTTLVASTPALLFLGTIGVVLAAIAVDRLGGTAKHLLAVDAVTGLLGLVLVRVTSPERWAEALARTDALFRSDGIAEVYGLFSTESFGFLFLLGFTLVLAIPAMLWAVRLVSEGRTDWLVAAVYAWYFLGLAAIQVRFVGEFATFGALFAGYGFVYLAAHIDLARPVNAVRDSLVSTHVPDARTITALVTLFLLVGSFGMLQTPIKTSQVIIEDSAYDTASAIEDDAAERGLEYPQNYVLSQWGRNRMYNYFVNGESRSYGYARSNYASFATATDSQRWANRLEGRAGYVVLTDDVPVDKPTALYSRLYENHGSRNDGVAGLARYRPVYASPDGNYKAFAIVPGATIQGSTTPNTTVTVTTTATVSNTTFNYTRQTVTDQNGRFAVTVANPGEYDLQTANSTHTVSVSETAVYRGQNVTGQAASS